MFLTQTFSPARKDTVFDSFIVLGGWKKVLLSIQIFLLSRIQVLAKASDYAF